MNKQRNYSKTGRITQGAAIAALYVALTMIVAPIAFGPVQFRISEALCVLPYFLPSAVPGVTIGCFLANLLCGAAPLDVVLRQSGNPDRGSWFLLSWEEEQMAGMCSADPCQYHHRSLGAALCVRLHRPDPICYGDSRNRRDSGHRRAGQYPASGTGAEPQSGIRTVKILCYSKLLFSTAFPCKPGAGLTVQVRSR